MSQDGKTIVAHWEKSSGRIDWEHDFDAKFEKASQGIAALYSGQAITKASLTSRHRRQQ